MEGEHPVSDESNVNKTESSPASNDTKKIKTDKPKIKTEDLNFHSVSKPRIRKKVHKVMKKYYKNEFYTQLDLAKKILKNLGFEATTSKQTTIRKYMLKWVDAHKEKDEDDSKKGIIEKVEPEVLVLKVCLNEEKSDKKDVGKNEGMEKEFEQTDKELNKDTTQEVPLLQNATSSKNVEQDKSIPFIDLTMDDEPIKEEIIVLDGPHDHEVNNQTNNQTNIEINYEQILQNVLKNLISSSIQQPIQASLPYHTITIPAAFSNSYIPYNPYPNVNNYPLYELDNAAYYQMYNEAMNRNDISYSHPQNIGYYQMYNQTNEYNGISYPPPPPPQNTQNTQN